MTYPIERQPVEVSESDLLQLNGSLLLYFDVYDGLQLLERRRTEPQRGEAQHGDRCGGIVSRDQVVRGGGQEQRGAQVTCL